MNTAAKGRRLEHKTQRWLEDQGYETMRSAGSKGKVDVIGWCKTGCVMVQSKSNEWPREIEMEGLRMMPVPPNTRVLIVRWRDRAGKPDVREI